MSCGKYSPTVADWYRKDQNWWEKNGGNQEHFGYDKDGYDMYGYNKDDRDRVGNTEWAYLSDEDLYSDVYGYYNHPTPTMD